MSYFPREGFVIHEHEYRPSEYASRDAFVRNVEMKAPDNTPETLPLEEVRRQVAAAIELRTSGNAAEADGYRLFGRPDTGITREAFGRVVRGWGILASPGQLRLLFDGIDADSNGVLDFHEFKALFRPDYTIPRDEGGWAGTNKVGSRPMMTSIHRRKLFKAAVRSGSSTVKARRRPVTVARALQRVGGVLAGLAKRHCREPAEILAMCFARYDRERSGALTKIEFAKMIRTGLGITMPHFELDALLERADANDDGRVCLSEFAAQCGLREGAVAADALAAIAPRSPPAIFIKRLMAHVRAKQEAGEERSMELALNRIFRRWDVDSSGCLSRKELHLFMRNELQMDLLPADVLAVLQYFDENGDGALSYAEVVDDVLRQATATATTTTTTTTPAGGGGDGGGGAVGGEAETAPSRGNGGGSRSRSRSRSSRNRSRNRSRRPEERSSTSGGGGEDGGHSESGGGGGNSRAGKARGGGAAVAATPRTMQAPATSPIKVLQPFLNAAHDAYGDSAGANSASASGAATWAARSARRSSGTPTPRQRQRPATARSDRSVRSSHGASASAAADTARSVDSRPGWGRPQPTPRPSTARSARSARSVSSGGAGRDIHAQRMRELTLQQRRAEVRGSMLASKLRTGVLNRGGMGHCRTESGRLH